MKSNYKKLGKYIREVDERNRDLKIEKLLGVSISKMFIPSIANTIGTDFGNYKIVRRGQFAYGPVTSRNGDKVSIALLDEDDCIISSSYTVFEIIDTKELLPEYLMMWFRRPEFDRYARYMSHGSVRELFGWNELCGVELPVPDITEQQKIVDEYNVLCNRIALNEQKKEKLEGTIQTIYKQWFVDFEFPNAMGEPYKSSGGMFYENENYNIPNKWNIGTIKSIANKVICGKTPSTLDESNFGGNIPFLTIPDMHDKYFVDKVERYLTDKGVSTQKDKTLPPNTVCVSCIGTAGLVVLTTNECQTNQQINSVIVKDNISFYYVLLALKTLGKTIEEYGSAGSVGSNLSKGEFEKLKLLIPSCEVQMNFQNLVDPIFKYLLVVQLELVKLCELKELIIRDIAKI